MKHYVLVRLTMSARITFTEKQAVMLSSQITWCFNRPPLEKVTTTVGRPSVTSSIPGYFPTGVQVCVWKACHSVVTALIL